MRTTTQVMIATAAQEWIRAQPWVRSLRWPVPIAALIEKAGMRVRWLPNAPAGFHGATMPGKMTAYDVWVNPHDPTPVQRFTLAHEFAHVLSHHLDYANPPWWFETEANAIAAELLLPWHELAVFQPAEPFTSPAAVETWMTATGGTILKRAGVSSSALWYHLQDLGWFTNTASTPTTKTLESSQLRFPILQ